MITPRDYQVDARDSLWHYFRNNVGNPLVLMPTGTGKSVVIGDFSRSVLQTFPRSRVMCVTHVETLIEQNHRKMLEVWPTAPAGIYSAGLNRRDTAHQVIFAGIQSVCDRAIEFGYVDLLIIDEAHLVSPKDETMYQQFIASLMLVNPTLKVIGLTATGWRLGTGDLVGSGIFTDVAIDMTTPAAWNWFVDCGYLVPLSSKKTRFHLDADGVGTVGGEYNMGQLQKHVDTENTTRQAVEEILQWGQDRHRWMVFAAGVQHCEHIAAMLNDYGVSTVAIHNKSKNPAKLIEAYKAGEYRAAVSMNKLTTGIDVPEIDLLAILRHTKSSSLWVQMLGRGTRPYYEQGYDLSTVQGRLSAIAAGCKARGCLVLDFARNTENLGPVNDPKIPPKKKPSKGSGGGAPFRVCPQCLEYCPASARFCKACGREFELKLHIDGEASTLEVMTRHVQEEPVVELIEVERVTYHVHQQRNSSKPPSLRVSYFAKGMMRKFEEYICFEHTGAARSYAMKWWKERTLQSVIPNTTSEAKQNVEQLRIPKKIRVWINASKPKVMSYEY